MVFWEDGLFRFHNCRNREKHTEKETAMQILHSYNVWQEYILRKNERMRKRHVNESQDRQNEHSHTLTFKSLSLEQVASRRRRVVLVNSQWLTCSSCSSSKTLNSMARSTFHT